MYLSKLIEKTQLDPKTILEILDECNPEAEKPDLHQFIGIINQDSKKKGANYCPAISFIQLLFHCDMVIQIISKKDIKHQIAKFYKMIIDKTNTTPVPFLNFANKWKGWNQKLIPKFKFDTTEFIQYFFESCPPKIRNLFIFKGKDTSFLMSSFILYVCPKQDTLQNIINDEFSQSKNIIFSDYLLISVNRKEQFYINHISIKINTYLQICNQKFKFNGVTTFSNEHYHSIVKICDHYFLFDDAEVCPLFLYNDCCEEVFNLMNLINNELKSNTSIILYQKINDDSIDSNLFENIFQESDDDDDSSDITTFNMDNIHGFILTKYKDIEETNEDETVSSYFSNFRKLFEISGEIFKGLNYCLDNDLFQYPKRIHQEDKSFYLEIANKGQLLKTIFEEIAENDDYDFQYVSSKVQEILDWYYDNFENLKRDDVQYDSIINNSLTDLIQLIESNEEELNESNEEELNESNEDEISNSNKEELKESNKPHNFSRPSNMNYKKNSFSICKQRTIDGKNIEMINDSFNDDNQFSLIEYDWSNRIKIDNVAEILKKIRRLLCGVKTIEGKKSTELRDLIIKEMLGFYFNMCNVVDDDNVIIQIYINYNCNPETISPNVRLFKQFHNKSIEDAFIHFEVFKKKVNEFKELTFAEKINFLQCENNSYKWGGRRGECKITNNTIICLIALMVDFPLMSSISYTSYINSIYGPNVNNKVKVATIRKYVRNLEYKVEMSKFLPPNRNSIGISVYRAAWSSIILEIINNSFVLPAFLDEAAIIVFHEKQKSYSYIGMSPTIKNNRNTILSVISMVIPHFGLIYRFINGEITSQDHVSFLKDSSNFIKKHINDKEIVVFEDNTPIHNDEINNKEIDKLHITVLPISPCSSSLNHVIGQYLSFIKTNVFVNKKDSNITDDVNVIMQKWEEVTNNGYTMSLINQSFDEWIDILQRFSNGNQIND